MPGLPTHPPRENTVHFVGDTHFGINMSGDAIRNGKLQADLKRLGVWPARVQCGDFTQSGVTSQIVTATTFFNECPGGYYVVVGNHDCWRTNGPTDPNGEIFAAETATYADDGYAFPTGLINWSVDLGFCVLVGVGPNTYGDGTCIVISQASLDWLDATLAAIPADRTVIVAAHPPLYDTCAGTLTPGTGDYTSTTTGFWVTGPTMGERDTVRDGNIRTILGRYPNVRAWMYGHTHSHITQDRLITTTTVGGREIACIGTSATCFIGYLGWEHEPQRQPVRSNFLTVYPDHLEVRWRDHTAGVWMGPFEERVVSVAA